MVDQQVNPRSLRWKRLFLISAGIGAGVTIAVIGTAVAALWYTSRPVKARPWNSTAISAKYEGLSVKTSRPVVCSVRYIVENHTGRDYVLPGSASLYKVLSQGKGLDRDDSLQWAGSTSLPAEQKINITIQIEYEYEESTPDPDYEKMTAFINRRLAEIDGFAALDEANRYEIKFPKPPDAKP